MSFKKYYISIIISLLDLNIENNNENPIKHFPTLIDKIKKRKIRKSCFLFNKKTSYFCPDCSEINKIIPLCFPKCFKKYHNNFWEKKELK